MIKRHISEKFSAALQDTPAVLLHGARQTGKSTLVKWMLKHRHKAEYISLDEPGYAAAAKNDPKGFIEGFSGNIAIDEIQKAPELLPVIKADIDTKRVPGKYILTGSSNLLLTPKVSESLAGRIELLTLFPFSQSELSRGSSNFIDDILDENFAPENQYKTENLRGRIIDGGYPEIQTRKAPERKKAWFDSYLKTILYRDIRDIANIERLTELPALLKILGARAGGMLNFAELSRNTNIPQSTLKRYLTLLRTTFLITQLNAYSGNLSKRMIKSPRIYPGDTGLISSIISADEKKLQTDAGLKGKMFESFIVLELLKLSSWSKSQPGIFYYRTASGQEIDVVLERNDGKLVMLEIKSAASPDADAFKHIKAFSNEYNSRFLRGVVIYTGDKTIPFGKNLTALPAGVLW